jgi:hypothetical protein
VLSYWLTKIQIVLQEKSRTGFFLWGMVPIGEHADSESLFLEQDKSYRITQKYTNTDILINVPVAFITSFIRSTMQIETCPSEVVVVAKEDYNRKEEKIVELEPAKSQTEIVQKMPFFIERTKIIVTLHNKQIISCPKVNLVLRQGEHYFEAYSSESNQVPLLIKNTDVKRIEFQESK